MSKSNQIKKLVNGEIADADDVNQIVENAGAEGGTIPYDPTSHERSTDGSQSLGSTAYPWGSLKINQDAEFVEVDPVSHTAAASVAIKNLRKFIYLKDAPSSYTGKAGLPLICKDTEDGVYFAQTGKSRFFSGSGSWVAPTDVTLVFVTMVGGGGAGGGHGYYGGGGGGAYYIRVGVKVTPGNTYTVTVGAGGTGNASANGNAGGNSSFAADNITLTANGGSGSETRAGGTASGNILNANTSTPGGVGQSSVGGNGSADATGAGGGTPFGVGGLANAGGDGYSGTGYGSGGGPGVAVGAKGGAGTAGMVYLEW